MTGALFGGLIKGSFSAIKGDDFLYGQINSTTDGPNASIAKRDKAQILQANREAHSNAVEKARQIIENAGGQDITTEVSIISDGTRVRLDLAANMNNMPYLIEVKSSLSAGFTPNQSIVYPRMSVNSPITPIGNNAINIFGYGAINQLTNNYTFVIWRF